MTDLARGQNYSVFTLNQSNLEKVKWVGLALTEKLKERNGVSMRAVRTLVISMCSVRTWISMCAVRTRISVCTARSWISVCAVQIWISMQCSVRTAIFYVCCPNMNKCVCFPIMYKYVCCPNMNKYVCCPNMNKWDGCPDVIKKYKWVVWKQVICIIRAVRPDINKFVDCPDIRWNVRTLINLWAVRTLLSRKNVRTFISRWRSGH